MNSFDFSRYDNDDITSYDIEKKKPLKKETDSSFDFSRYDEEEEQKQKTLSEEFKDFFIGEKPNPLEEGFLDTIKAGAKGTIEGVSNLGRMMSPLQGESLSKEEQKANLDELIGGEESYPQSGLRRGLAEAPSIMSFPGGGSLPRSIAAGFVGEGAKELGLPEWAQTAAELTVFIGPDITKKLLSSGKNEELIAFAKKMGMTDEQITPLIQSDFKQRWLSKLSPKRGSTAEALKSTKSGIDQSYSVIQNSNAAAMNLGDKGKKVLFDDMTKAFKDMPSEVREKVRQDLTDLVSKPITGESLINFYKDVNYYLGQNAKQLALLKDPIKNALKTISPELGKDFEMVNQLYTKYYPIASKLKPSIVSDIMSASETIATLGAIFTGNFAYLTHIAGERAARKLSQQLLINPRFQQIGKKTVQAMNEGKYAMVKKLSDLYAHEIRKTSPEIADKLLEMTEDELKDFFIHQEQTSEQ